MVFGRRQQLNPLLFLCLGFFLQHQQFVMEGNNPQLYDIVYNLGASPEALRLNNMWQEFGNDEYSWRRMVKFFIGVIAPDDGELLTEGFIQFMENVVNDLLLPSQGHFDFTTPSSYKKRVHLPILGSLTVNQFLFGLEESDVYGLASEWLGAVRIWANGKSVPTKKCMETWSLLRWGGYYEEFPERVRMVLWDKNIGEKAMRQFARLLRAIKKAGSGTETDAALHALDQALETWESNMFCIDKVKLIGPDDTSSDPPAATFMMEGAPVSSSSPVLKITNETSSDDEYDGSFVMIPRDPSINLLDYVSTGGRQKRKQVEFDNGIVGHLVLHPEGLECYYRGSSDAKKDENVVYV